mmetsp:Transcript_3407/g.4614  ORF Transcript_3407/g.4614 Transcript_3407/m.4614 type:complete len:92 (-) Transcript_3407:727-1002(-)
MFFIHIETSYWIFLEKEMTVSHKEFASSNSGADKFDASVKLLSGLCSSSSLIFESTLFFGKIKAIPTAITSNPAAATNIAPGPGNVLFLVR